MSWLKAAWIIEERADVEMTIINDESNRALHILPDMRNPTLNIFTGASVSDLVSSGASFPLILNTFSEISFQRDSSTSLPNSQPTRDVRKSISMFFRAFRRMTEIIGEIIPMGDDNDVSGNPCSLA